MILRRICTIGGRAYILTGHCTTCGDPMWTTQETPTAYAGCTTTQCLHTVRAPRHSRRSETRTPTPSARTAVAADEDNL
jgi:hypothetical protein